MSDERKFSTEPLYVTVNGKSYPVYPLSRVEELLLKNGSGGGGGSGLPDGYVYASDEDIDNMFPNNP